MFSLFKKLMKWLDRKIEGEPQPKFLSGKGKGT